MIIDRTENQALISQVYQNIFYDPLWLISILSKFKRLFNIVDTFGNITHEIGLNSLPPHLYYAKMFRFLELL